MSSYETAVEYTREQHKKGGYEFKLTTIKPYYDNEDYIHALCESIKPHLESDYDLMLFSYHGVPVRHIYKGDITGQHCLKVTDCCDVASEAHKYCYRHQCWTTTKLVTQKLNIPKEKWKFSFQSRLGRDPWLQPYTAVQLAELPKQGIKKIAVVCPAFVSDCLETLEEMAIQGREIFMDAGGESFQLIPCMNTQYLWIEAITKWFRNYLQGDKTMVN